MKSSIEQAIAFHELTAAGEAVDHLSVSPKFADGTTDTYKLRQMHNHLRKQGLHYSGTDTVGKTKGSAGSRIHRYSDKSGEVKTGIHEDTGFDGNHSFATPDNKVDHAQGKSYNSALDAEITKRKQAQPEYSYESTNKVDKAFE